MIILNGEHFGLEITGEVKNNSWTENIGGGYDSRYGREDDDFRERKSLHWTGAAKLTDKQSGEKHFFNFETFCYENDDITKNDTSLKAMILKIKDAGESKLCLVDEKLLIDFLSQKIISSLNNQREREDGGMLGLKFEFNKELLNSKELINSGILTEENYQVRLPL